MTRWMPIMPDCIKRRRLLRHADAWLRAALAARLLVTRDRGPLGLAAFGAMPMPAPMARSGFTPEASDLYRRRAGAEMPSETTDGATAARAATEVHGIGPAISLRRRRCQRSRRPPPPTRFLPAGLLISCAPPPMRHNRRRSACSLRCSPAGTSCALAERSAPMTLCRPRGDSEYAASSPASVIDSLADETTV